MKPYYDEDGITIYHGDCLDVLPQLPADSVDLVVTDPPYGVAWQSSMRQDCFDIMAGDNDKGLMRASLKEIGRVLRGMRHLYCFGAEAADLQGLSFSRPMEIIWDKGKFGLGDLASVWMPQHEKILFTVLVSAQEQITNGRGNLTARLRRGSVIRIARLNGNGTEHPTEKPVELLRILIESSSMIGETVLDPFVGSGSTLVAARKEDRKAIGIEIEERHCEVAARRLSQRVLDFHGTEAEQIA